jgi:CobQ-like glutamine amidotransferase family enzyme
MELKICHLYPDVLNLYGDRGNILCMQKRLAWRGIGCSVTELPIGESASLSDFDLFFIGGGQDFEQGLLLEDLRRGKANDLRAAIEDGKTFLCVCGGYQMMGHYYETAAGQRCEFLGAVDFHTVGSDTRMIGNFAF